LPIHSLTQVTPQGVRPLAVNGSGWKIDIEPYDGAVVEWK